MSITLETLELTDQELELCKNAVRKMAYFNWLDAGRPEHAERDCWLQAEKEWLEHSYVPHRRLDGMPPQARN
jgi:hypothetical protein